MLRWSNEVQKSRGQTCKKLQRKNIARKKRKKEELLNVGDALKVGWVRSPAAYTGRAAWLMAKQRKRQASTSLLEPVKVVTL